MVIIARWPQVSWPHLAILHTADDTSLAAADDLLRCDWLRRVRLIITWAVRHLAIVTLGMIGGDASELFYWQVRYLDIYQFYDYGVNITNRKNIKPWMTVLLCTFDKYKCRCLQHTSKWHNCSIRKIYIPLYSFCSYLIHIQKNLLPVKFQKLNLVHPKTTANCHILCNDNF